MAVEKNLAYKFKEINKMYQDTYLELDMEIDSETELKKRLHPWIQFATEMRKIMSLIKAKRRNAGLEQFEILIAGSRRNDVFVLTLILPSH